jgi:Arc/MetJ-type ribon-helix-helix transcriptional regulator
MSTQIAVRLSDELVEYVDRLVREGAGSRAVVVASALNLYRQQLRGEQDARILEESGDYDDFDDLARHSSIADS